MRFVGCGSGAADLLTLRAVRALESADVVIWNIEVSRRGETLATSTSTSWPKTVRDLGLGVPTLGVVRPSAGARRIPAGS